jgi:hypothetical protein
MSITTPPTTVPSPRPTPNKGNLTPSEAAAQAASTVPQGQANTGGKRSLTGAPIGTPVLKGQRTVTGILKGKPVGQLPIYGATQYSSESAAVTFASLGNQEKIDLLATLARIPGLYPRKKAPTDAYIAQLAALSTNAMIPTRPEDEAALEKVMRYADTVGEDYVSSLTKLANNPNLAQQYFDPSGSLTGGKKIRTTPAEALALELEQSVADYLDARVSKKETAAYVKRVNDLEKKRGGALTSVERNQLLLDTIQTKAAEVFKDGIDEADTLLMRKGALGGTFNLLRQTYSDYGIPVDEKTLYRQAIGSVRSKQALDNTLNKISLQAEVAMPALRTYIQQGLSPREALGSYVNLYSKFMGVPENQVDLTKLAPVFSGDKVMPYNEWEKYLYTLPEAANSPVVKEQKMNDYRTLIRNFIG